MSTVRCYIASALRCYKDAESWADRLRIYGATVTSRWHSLVEEGCGDPPDEGTRRTIGIDNMADLSVANCLLYLAGIGQPNCAKAEFGAAVGRAMPVIYLLGPNGEGRMLWDSMPCVYRVTSPSGVLPALYTIETSLRETPSSVRMRLPSTPPSDASGAFQAATEYAQGKRKAGTR